MGNNNNKKLFDVVSYLEAPGVHKLNLCRPTNSGGSEKEA